MIACGKFDLGWSHRVYSGFRHIDDSNAANPVDCGLDLPAFTTDNLVIAPLAGVEWAAGDHWSSSPASSCSSGPR